MPTINQLPVLSTINSGDQLPVYSPNNGDARRTSIGSLLTFFQQSFASPTLAVNLYVPGNGFNITVPTPVSNDQWMLLQPAGTLATGTITLPLNTGVPDGTTVLITTTQEITSLTIALNGATALYGGVTTLAAGSATAIRFYQPTNSWYQINAETTYAAGIQAFLAAPSSANLRAAMTDETGTGLLVFNNTPTLISPILGTVTSGNISACTSTSMVLVTPILGVPTSGTLTNCTGLPVGTGVSGLGANVATFLATPSSANLAAALTDETGTGASVFANTPTLVTPAIGAATGTSLTLTSFVSTPGNITNNGGTGRIGYATGAGGSVTQLTSKSTGVTLSKQSGQITMDGAALAASTTVSFTLTNTILQSTDVLILNHAGTGTAGAYLLNAQVVGGSASINVRNVTLGSLSEAIVIAFIIISGAVS
tara:strand:+ start:2162 stop:3436 length:1275 start_codon:yes stop_codon:yes gene_type:complete